MYGLDLFSGIGGITKALEGYSKPVAYCENDRYCQGVLLSRIANLELPSAPIWDDVRTLGVSLLPKRIDIIYGGFPCQDISVAGRGAGLDGERSGLFFEIARLVREIRPRFVFLENVPAITSRGGVRVVSEFASIGYDCRWDLLSAADVGANHLRERWWLLAHSRHGSGRDVGVFERWQDSPQERRRNNNAIGGSSKQPTVMADAGGESIQRIAERRSKRQEQDSTRAEWWSTEPNVGRVAHGVPMRVDRLRGLGNSVCPLQARTAFERLMGLK